MPNTKDKYSGRAESSIPMRTVYDFTVAESKVVHGMLTMASTRLECVLSSRETTWVRASIQVFNEVDILADVGSVRRFGLNWSTSSSNGWEFP